MCLHQATCPIFAGPVTYDSIMLAYYVDISKYGAYSVTPLILSNRAVNGSIYTATLNLYSLIDQSLCSEYSNRAFTD